MRSGRLTDQRPYRATRAELRAIDQALGEKKLAPAKSVRAAFNRFKIKRGTSPKQMF